MKKDRITVIICAVILCTAVTFTVLLTVVTSFSKSLDELQNEIDSKQSQSGDIEDRIDSLKNQKKSAEKTAAQNEAELNRIRDELSKEYTKREKAIAQLNEMKESINGLDKSIEDVQKQYDKSVSEFLQRARLMYRYSDYSTLELILESENILDFSSRANMYTHMIEYDRELIEEISLMKKDLNTKKEYQLSMENDRQAILNEIEEMIAYLERSENNTLDEYESNLNKISSLSEQQKKLEEEEARLEAEIKKLMADSKLYKYEGGKMLWPLKSWVRISDSFGYREVHPITGLPAFHGGIDISAYGGTEILAAAGGKVIVVNYSDGSGNYLVIDHGGGICTMYAHCSKIIAKVNQTVKQGDVIALVGSTGNSTGNHLHFEIRDGAEKVDPMNYLNVPSK